MREHVCPWWLAFSFDNPLRRMVHNPERMLGPYLKDGMTALDVGCGMGYFSLGMARIVGERGRVFSIDIQDHMLARVRARAEKMEWSERIITIRSVPERIGSPERVDFALAFWMVHETPHKEEFFSEIRSLLKKEAVFLMVEPRFHVSGRQFLSTLGAARKSGLQVVKLPRIGLSRAALLKRDDVS